MSKDTSTPATKTDSTSSPEIEQDGDELFEENEFVSLSEEADKEAIRRDARRKIEIYWEKKRLRDQFEDFDDSEFGF
jgi:hypothetical protein